MTALLARVCRTLGHKNVMPTEHPVSTQVVSEWPTGDNRGTPQLWRANTIRKEAVEWQDRIFASDCAETGELGAS